MNVLINQGAFGVPANLMLPAIIVCLIVYLAIAWDLRAEIGKVPLRAGFAAVAVMLAGVALSADYVIMDPMASFCSTLEKYGYWWHFWDCGSY